MQQEVVYNQLEWVQPKYQEVIRSSISCHDDHAVVLMKSGYMSDSKFKRTVAVRKYQLQK